MSDIQVGIKITADGKIADATIVGLQGTTLKLGETARKTTRDLASLSAGWSAFSAQGAAKLAAIDNARRLTDGLTAAAAQAERLRRGIALFDPRPMKELDATVKSSQVGLESYVRFLGRAYMTFMAVQQAAGAFRSVIDTQAEFDRLGASLKTVTGSVQQAGSAMAMLRELAVSTPYTLQQMTEAFIRLQSMGLDASAQSLRAYGNTAAAMGKPLMQFVEAVADATTNEFERLKEFGIKAKQEGDQVSFTFRGVTTTVQKSADAIQGYLLDIGKITFASGMTEQMKTVGGAMSNMDDAWSRFKLNISSSDSIIQGITRITQVINTLNSLLEKSRQYGDAFRVLPNKAEVARALNGGQTGLDPNRPYESPSQAAPTSPTGPLSTASKYVGMSETQRAAELTEYLNKYSGTTSKSIAGTVNAWCARFVSAVLNESKQPSLNTASSLAYANYGKGIWQRGMSKDALADVQPGDIAVFTRRGGGHVGFVKAIDPTKGLLEILGGNQSNAVSVAKRSMSDLLAIRRPPVPGAKGEYEDFDKYQKRAKKEREDAQREAEKRQRDATQRYIANLDDQAKAAQRQAEMAVSGIDTQIAALDHERDAWDKAQQDKLDAAKGSYDAMAQLEAERAAKLQDYAARELALIQQQYDARKQAMEAAASAFRKQLDSPNQLTDDEERRAKQSLADVQADLIKLANERAQAEAKAGQAAQDATRGGLELAQKQREFIAGINADLEFQKQLYLKLKAAKEAGATPQQLDIMATVSGQMRDAGQSVSAQELLALELLLTKLEMIKQKNQELLGVNQAVREEQLRLNQAWQEATEQARLFAEQASQAFGALGNAIGKVVVGMAEYGQRAMQIQRDAQSAMENLRKSGKSTPEKEFQIMERAADKSLSNQMGLWGDLSAAASGFFKEGSDGYKAMTAASQAFYAIKMGLAVKDAVLQIATMIQIMMADEARTGVEVANSTARAMAKGAEAVMNQGQGDPYSAIPRMIAMAAMVTTILAGFGIAIAGAVSGGGGTSAKVPDTDALQKKQGSGSVYGDAEAQSASLRNSLALLEDNSSADLDYTREMRDLLEHIDEGINGVANQLYATVRPPQLTEAMIKKGIEAVDYGIQGIQQTVGSILKGGLQGQSYQTYKREVEKSSFNFMMPGMGGGEGEKVVKWVRTIFNDIDAGIAKQFGAVLGDVVKSLTLAADGLGVAGPDMVDKINKFVVDIGQVSLKDMNAKEMGEALHAVISRISDDLARLTMPMLKPFRRAGEGFAETTIRVYEAVTRVQPELKGLGVAMIDMADITEKTAKDLDAQIMRESIARAEQGSSIGEYIRTLKGGTDDITEQYRALLSARNLFAASGRPEANLGGDMITGAGGFEKFTAGLDSYRENFLTGTERLTAGWMDMANNFTAVGLKMPRTNAEFRALVEGIDTSTKAGRELKGAIIAMAPAFNELQSAMDDAMSALQDAYNKAKEQAKSLKDYLDSLKTGDMASGSPLDRYRAAQQQYEDLLRRYNAGDVSVTPDMLQSAASTYLSLSKQIFAGTTQYASDVQRVESSLSGIAGKLDAQISKAAAQVPALESNTGAVNSLSAALASYTETMRRVGEVISGQKINGKSINDINAGNNSDDAAKKAKDAKELEAQAFEKRLADMTRDLRYAREHGQDNKADKIKADIEAYIAQIQASGVFSVAWDGKRHDVSYRAKGGYTPPGWTVVGEQGPELVNFTSPARVYTAQQTREALRQNDDGKTFAALEAIKDEMRALVRTQTGANPAIIGELQALRKRLEDLERNQRMKA